MGCRICFVVAGAKQVQTCEACGGIIRQMDFTASVKSQKDERIEIPNIYC